MTNTKPFPYLFIDFEKISLDGTVKSLNATKVAANTCVYIQVQSTSTTATAARIYYHGSDPSETEGYKYIDKDSILLEGRKNLENLRFIRDTGASAITPELLVSYLKPL